RGVRCHFPDCARVRRRPVRGIVGHCIQSRHRDGAAGRNASPLARRSNRRRLWNARLIRYRAGGAHLARSSPFDSVTVSSPGTYRMTSLSSQWLSSTRSVLDDIEATQGDAIQKAAQLMADSIEAE